MTKKFWNTATAWIDRNEGRVLVAFLVSYAFLMFVMQGEVRVHWDNPGYVDPSVNYVTGHGFTSTCWYAQSGAAFWAGNVPLYQFLLIPWFKIFGVSYSAVLWLNFLYVAAGSLLIWRAMQKSGFVRTAHWRVGAVAFFLLTDCAHYVLTFGRYDALGFLLIALAANLLTAQSPARRLGGLFCVAALLPWAHLATVVYSAVLGCLLLVFYPKRFWKEVLVFGVGGAMGTLALASFYHHFGVWDAFLKSIAPHVGAGSTHNDMEFQSNRRGGFTQTFDLPYAAVAACIFLIIGLLRNRWRFPLFVVVCMVAVPTILFETGVFSLHYGWMLLFLSVVFLFAMLSKEARLEPFSLCIVLCIVLGSMVIPGSFARAAMKNRLLLHHEGNFGEKMAEFVQKNLRHEDVAWMAEEFYYGAKPKVGKIFSSPVVFSDFNGTISYPGREEDLASITVCVWSQSSQELNRSRLKKLPGQWRRTGETMNAWGTTFAVYRRTTDIPAHPPHLSLAE